MDLERSKLMLLDARRQSYEAILLKLDNICQINKELDKIYESLRCDEEMKSKDFSDDLTYLSNIVVFPQMVEKIIPEINNIR